MNYVITLSSGKKLDRKEFAHYFERKVFKTIRRFGLIDIKDKIAVACSGGKDSNVALYVLNKLCKERRQHIEAIAVDEGIKDYRGGLLKKLNEFCKKINVRLTVFSFKKEYKFNLDRILKKIKKAKLSNCYACSILKRWLINKKAREMRFDVIATGHSLDDEAETIILNQMKGNPQLLAKLGPLSGIARGKEFVQRIKPLYFCTEKEIVLYAKLKNIPLSPGICPRREDTLRVRVRNFLKSAEKRNVGTKNSIVSSFLKILHLLKEKYEKEMPIKKCHKCGEPSAQEICKRCQILKLLKNN